MTLHPVEFTMLVQERLGVTADGLPGPKTMAALDAKLPAPQAPVAPPTGTTIYQGSARHPVREVVIHCTATRPEWMAGRPLSEKRAEIRRWHVQDRGWKDIGYHWLIDRDGQVIAGRAENVVGAHVEGRNSGTLGVSLIGGHGAATSDAFADNFTTAQAAALRKLLGEIGQRTRIDRITGHYMYANKACPGFLVDRWLKGA